MRKLVTYLLLFAAVSVLGANIRWLERDYDFGLFKEVGGPKTGYSRFVNTGTDTISIFSVRPSCGCTSADFTHAPIAPGDTATVSFTYDPTMRPGKFDKSVQVRFSDGSKQTIRITGSVLGTPESLESLYPVDAGELRLSDRIISFDETTKGRSPVRFVNAYVLSNDSVVPVIKALSDALTITPSVSKAGPGDVVTFTLTLNTSRLEEYGPVEVAAQCGEARLEAVAVVMPDATDLKLHQQGKHPAADVSPQVIDLSSTDVSLPITRSFSITNKGKADLELLRIYCGSEAVKIGKYPKKVKPGKTVEVTFELDRAALRPGPQRLPIEILTNDPMQPRQSVALAIR